MPKKAAGKMLRRTGLPVSKKALLADVRGLIEDARQDVARAVNSTLVTLYWRIGKRINEEILKGSRAEYGKEIVVSLARQLEADYGRGFSEKSLRHMLRFAEAFPDEQIVSALMRQLSWTHFLAIIYLPEPLQRDFYAEMCRIERWSTRTLQKKIGSMLYERTALSRKPDKLIRQELKALRNRGRCLLVNLLSDARSNEGGTNERGTEFTCCISCWLDTHNITNLLKRRSRFAGLLTLVPFRPLSGPPRKSGVLLNLPLSA